MAGKFNDVYGKALNIQGLFESKGIRWYLEMLFIVLGVGALIFAVFNITGPINNW